MNDEYLLLFSIFHFHVEFAKSNTHNNGKLFYLKQSDIRSTKTPTLTWIKIIFREQKNTNRDTDNTALENKTEMEGGNIELDMEACKEQEVDT